MGARATSLVGAALGGAVAAPSPLRSFSRPLGACSATPPQGRYTRWVYCQTLFLLQLLPFSGGAPHRFVNGLGFPSHPLLLRDYSLLREQSVTSSGRYWRQQRMPAVVLLGCDAAAHLPHGASQRVWLIIWQSTLRLQHLCGCGSA